MVLPFNLNRDLIIVPVRLVGPDDEQILRFALDTGATSSVLDWECASQVGYTPSALAQQIQITTASGAEPVIRIAVKRFEALGQQRHNFPVLCYVLPSGVSFDGLLGLDFFQGHKLTLDFRIGLVTLE